jgi:hypothetical protein
VAPQLLAGLTGWALGDKILCGRPLAA